MWHSTKQLRAEAEGTEGGHQGTFAACRGSQVASSPIARAVSSRAVDRWAWEAAILRPAGTVQVSPCPALRFSSGCSGRVFQKVHNEAGGSLVSSVLGRGRSHKNPNKQRHPTVEKPSLWDPEETRRRK